jgi:hypothetical protein
LDPVRYRNPSLPGITIGLFLNTCPKLPTDNYSIP